MRSGVPVVGLVNDAPVSGPRTSRSAFDLAGSQTFDHRSRRSRWLRQPLLSRADGLDRLTPRLSPDRPSCCAVRRRASAACAGRSSHARSVPVQRGRVAFGGPHGPNTCCDDTPSAGTATSTAASGRVTAGSCSASRRGIAARPEVIEDACAFAWLELIARQPEHTNVMAGCASSRAAKRSASPDTTAALHPWHRSTETRAPPAHTSPGC
jgi:hypothetical protein